MNGCARRPATVAPGRNTGTRSASGRWLCALLVALASACARAPEPPAALDSAVRRLTRADFGQGEVPAHGPVVKIGDEAREVALAPQVLEIATLRGLRLDQGKARREIELPIDARTLPDEAFQLDVQELPFAGDLPESVFDFFATETFHKLVDTRWHLERDPARAGVVQLEVAPLAAKQDVQFNVDLRARLPQPKLVESTAFAVPDEATISLGYGVVGTGARSAIRFRASLRCASTAELPLLDDTITPDVAAAGWRDTAVALPAATGCLLRLETTTPEGDAVRAGAWSEPLVFARSPVKTPPAVDNVIVVSLDTLRADHLSGLGYPRATSPTIDAHLIAPGTTFADASTTFPRTDVAHLSLFTSLFPEAQPAPGRLGADTTAALLTESLRAAGLVTAGFTEDAMIAGAFGFWFGFDRFVERAFADRERGHATFADGIDFMRTNRERRFFLFLHTYKTHQPYVTSEKYGTFADAADWGRLPLDERIPEKERAHVDAYDRTIREADDLMASLLGELARLGLAERTLVVLLSDHGEAFGEHGSLEHGYAGHQEQLQMALVFRGPGVPAGVRIDTPVSIVDVAPTVLELAGAAPLPYAQGISLAPAFAGRSLPAARPLFFSWLAQGALGVRHGQWKYLRADHGHELFDLASDPQERLPRGRKRPPRPVEAGLLAAYQADGARLRAQFNAHAASRDSAVPIEGRMQESLRALGYVE